MFTYEIYYYHLQALCVFTTYLMTLIKFAAIITRLPAFGVIQLFCAIIQMRTVKVGISHLCLV